MTFDAIILWVTATLISLFGYLLIVPPSEVSIQTHESNARMLATRIERIETVLRGGPHIERTYQQIQRELQRIAFGNRNKDPMTLLLRTIARESKRQNTLFVSFTPSNIAVPSPGNPTFTSRDISFSVRGSFRALLDFLPRLSIDDPLLEIQAITIQTQTTADPVPRPNADLQVEITARLYHISAIALYASHARERTHPHRVTSNIL